jgi:type IV pilus assembly protein PilV
MSARRKQPQRAAGGFSLIEVMVALLVTSVGLLGLASLQLVSLKQNHGAYLRSQATALAHDMVERMRANRQQALSGAYDVDFGDTGGSGLAATDLAQWQGAIDRTLPEGDGAVAVNSASGLATVSVRWDDARGDEGAENTPADEDLVFAVTTEL